MYFHHACRFTYVAKHASCGRKQAWAAEEAIIGLPYCDVEPLITLTTEFYTTFSILEGPAPAIAGKRG